MGTIIKRGNSWRAVIRKVGHPVKTKTFSRKVLAANWIAETELAMERSEGITANKRVGDLFQRYITEILPSRGLEANSKYVYRSLRHWTADLTLEDLTADGLLAWKKQHCPRASPASFDRYLSHIIGVLKDAEAFWQIRIPYDTIRKARTALNRIGAISGSHSRDRRPDPGELDDIKRNLGTYIPLADIIDFAVITGLRAGEIVRIRWDGLDQQKKTIIVKDRKHPTRKKGNDCVVPLLFDSIEILLRQPRTDPRIFPFKVDSMTSAFNRARTSAGVKNLHFHDLRHEAISRMFEAGFSIPEVSVVSGHIGWESLRRYVNLKPESLHKGPINKKSV